jgi:hypothetical protein
LQKVKQESETWVRIAKLNVDDDALGWAGAGAGAGLGWVGRGKRVKLAKAGVESTL